MTDKVRKIREEVEKLKSQLIRGACSSQIAMETRCKEEAYNEVLAIIDSLQEEPVSEDLEEASKNYALNNTPWDDCKDEIQESFKAGAKWQEKRLLPMIDKICGMCQKQQDFINSKDLGELISTLNRRYPEVSFAKLSRIAVRVAKWQKLKDMGITNNAKGVVTNILNSSDKPLDTYATEVAFIMIPANLTENYHMTNRDRISDAVRLGAQWQKEKEYTCYEEAFEDGAKWKKEQMIANAIDGIARPYDNEVWCNLASFNLEDGDKVKVIVIKED